MKRIALLTTLFAAMAIIASAQSMSDSSSGSGNDNGSMMAPADSMSGTPAMKGSSDSMMAEPNSMKGSTDSMMAAMDYETLKKEGKLADPKMGMQLRIAMSSGMKVSYKNLMSAEGLANKNPTVLFFAADWCPSCQADLKDINANGAQLGQSECGGGRLRQERRPQEEVRNYCARHFRPDWPHGREAGDLEWRRGAGNSQ